MKIPNSNKFFFIVIGILLTFTSLLIWNLKFGVDVAIAQIPAPVPVPCEDPGRYPEFNSLRPYQASPCEENPVPTAKFCGNELIFHDTITKEYPGEGDCTQSGGEVTCKYSVSENNSLVIDLSNANLPIMGNTEETRNSLNKDSESLKDADKINNYVSWYLNGVINRAEYPFINASKNCIGETTQRAGTCLNTSAGVCLYPNPLPILPNLPNPTLTADGASSCGGEKSCCVTVSPFANEITILDRDKLINYSGPINKLLPQETLQEKRAQTVEDARDTRHNQIVGCTYGVNIFGVEIGGIPAPCYESGLLGSVPRQKHRLDDWENHLPPIRSKYKNYIDYLKDYQEWKGKGCFEVKVPDIVPVIGGKGILLCLDNLLKPNYYAALYSYIPLSSTEDLEGSVSIDRYSSATDPSIGGVTVSGVSFSNQAPATLFFSHMQESNDLASTLQDTFVSKSEQENKIGAPTNVAQPASCTTVDVRSNKGDDFFATEIVGDLHYDATFSCTFQPIPTCKGLCLPNQSECFYAGGTPGMGTCFEGKYCCNIPGATPYPVPVQSCTKDIYISLSTTSRTPKVESVWSQLVAGPQSIFKRIFPKTNTEGSVGQIIDIPGSTNITYSGLGISQQDTDLKIPHIGGISEYFLKGIQTALRPKGFGETITFGVNGNMRKNCVQNIPDSAIPSKYLGSFKSNFINRANDWTTDCPGADNNLAEECYNYVVSESQKGGINPAFALTIWLNESGASNYCHGGATTQDFGINISSLYQNIGGQLERFLKQPAAYEYCKLVKGWVEPMHAFLSRFQSSRGVCDPNDPVATQYYIDVRDTTWSWVSGCSGNGRFGIKWPTDNSCP